MFIMSIMLTVLLILIGAAFLTLVERKVLKYIQIRKDHNKVGMLELGQIRKDPNKVGMFEFIQSIADAIK